VVFSSIVFLFYFLPAFLVVYTAVPGTRLKNLVLLLVSLLFYAWGEPGFVFVLCGQILFNYRAALAIRRQPWAPAQARDGSRRRRGARAQPAPAFPDSFGRWRRRPHAVESFLANHFGLRIS